MKNKPKMQLDIKPENAIKPTARFNFQLGSVW